MIIIIVFASLAVTLGSLGFIAGWTSHIWTVKDECNIYAWGTFAQFKKQFAKYTWYRRKEFPGSFFHEEHDVNMIHANILKFGNVGMILYPIDYLMFKVWEQRNSATRGIRGYWKLH